MTNFQLIFTGAFVAFIVLGMVAFSLFTSSNNNGVGRVQIWGTADVNVMGQVIATLGEQDKSFQEVTYVQKSPATYTADVINAMASGAGPDLIFLNQEQVQTFSDKILTIPYSAVSQSSFISSFIDEGQLFLTPQGPVALPILVNPLVMYWNRDMFATAGIAQPPKYWDDFLSMAGKLTVLDSGSNIKKSAIALGGWDNILYAKAILSTLVMQAGDPIVAQGADGAQAAVFGATPQSAAENPAASALQFYTEFANPSKVTYSWNRSLPSSGLAFASGDVAVYIGFASDYDTIAARNPNLHFGVAVVPQIQGNSTHLTFGQITGLAIPRTSTNAQGALTIAQKLSSEVGVARISAQFALPPVRVDVPQDSSASAAQSTYYQSALIARGWLDPNTSATDDIFKTMVESVVSNKSLPSSAVADAARSLQTLFSKNSQ